MRRRRRRAWAKEETDGLFSPALRSSNVKRGAAKVCLIQECHARDGIERRLLLGRSSIRVRRVREGDVSFSNDGLRRSPLDGGVLDENGDRQQKQSLQRNDLALSRSEC